MRQRETIPDEVVRRADQIELVDMSPEALRRRLAHGNVYPAEKIDASMSQYFRVGNLTALRELALLWTADRVDEALRPTGATTRSRRRGRPASGSSSRSRAGPESETLVRRAARIAQRGSRGEFLAVHVLGSDGLPASPRDSLGRAAGLVESLGGTLHTVLSDDVPSAVVDFAAGCQRHQIVVGVSRRSRLADAVAPGVAAPSHRRLR